MWNLAAENLFMARLAEQTGQYEEMAGFMKVVLTEKGPDMNLEERNLLQLSHKKSLQKQRDTWRVVNAILEDPKYSDKETNLLTYKKQLEDRIYEMAYQTVSMVK